MSADPAAAKCSEISGGTLAWCKTADANKFTNGLISDSEGIPVVGLMCKADPCTPADDGVTCCEDTSESGGGTNSSSSLGGGDEEADGVGKKIEMMSMALAGLALVVGCL